MINERPLILLPSPFPVERKKNVGFGPKIKYPSAQKQFERLSPSFNKLQKAFEYKKIQLQKSPTGINPDFALVFEIIGSVENFYAAVEKTEGLEWMFDTYSDKVNPDQDFYNSKDNTRQLDGKIYCIMSNQKAMKRLLGLWEKYAAGKDAFKRGFKGLRDVFAKIKTIRKWNTQDRISETYMMENWRAMLEDTTQENAKFEIELFFRNSESARQSACNAIKKAILNLQGRILQECILPEIAYHGLLVELPNASIEDLVNNYANIELARLDEIMFFRPTCQSAFFASSASVEYSSDLSPRKLESGNPIIALLDGMPLQNHFLLKDRLIIDDPENLESKYESCFRKHGTAMASLIIYGDLNKKDNPIRRPIYVRPILQPLRGIENQASEVIPNNKLLIDTIHCAVRRMFEGEAKTGATAATVKIVNLSIGDPCRQLTNIMSPLARLIDYLSYKYKILFVISAGNHPEIINEVNISFDDFQKMSLDERSNFFGSLIWDNQRNLKVLSPAGSLNSLSIGALYDDFSSTVKNSRLVSAVQKGMPAPFSSYGMGYNSSIKPDLFYYGGRLLLRSNGTKQLAWHSMETRGPGCRVAAPFNDSSGEVFSSGTSHAAAQITHESARCYDILEEIFHRQTDSPIPEDLTAVLIKAMLSHGASWSSVANEISQATTDSEKKISQWIGNGIPNINHVIHCTKERVTFIGYGHLESENGALFKIPLPIDFSSQIIKRKLTATLAYLSPIKANTQAYRAAQLWFDLKKKTNQLVPYRQNTEWRRVRRGTLQHEIFSGDKAVVWDNGDLEIQVNCKADAENIKNEKIPYALFVSFEIAKGFDIDLYSKVCLKLRNPIPIFNN